LEISPQAKILQGGGVLLVGAVDSPEKSAMLSRKGTSCGARGTGVEVKILPNAAGKVELKDLLEALGRRGINEVHVEAGFKLNGSLMREGLVDEVLLYLAPCLVGDNANGLFNLPELSSLAGKQSLQIRDVRQVGADIRVLARLA
jgi:diaminohydroxyphosphoribosylaminopyrimidine deaminase/5-amino-6-(5-phosphoribosylamino)uracil reductase